MKDYSRKCLNKQIKGGYLVRCKSRYCEACEQIRRNEWIGRLLAESFRSDHTLMVTLTLDAEGLEKVGSADPKVVWSNYIREMRKALRPLGIKMKHYGVSEFGSKNGRLHWHGILFFRGGFPPDIVLNFSTKQAYWPHGNSQYEVPRGKGNAIAYVYDYLTQKGGMEMPKSNGLGKEYLIRWAVLQAESGMNPFKDFGFLYRIPDDRDHRKRSREYWLPSSHLWMTEIAKAYYQAWVDKWGSRKGLPESCVRFLDE